MNDKQSFLIIKNSDKATDKIKQVCNAIDAEATECHPEDAIQTLCDNNITAVVALEEWFQSDNDLMHAITQKINELSIQTLILAQDAQQVNTQGPQPEKTITISDSESPEMLKGRLTTLMEIHPIFKQMSAEMDMLRSIGQPMSNYMEKVDEEMRLAARLQHDFLPKNLPEIPRFKFASVYRPATWVSGDIYDVMRLDEKHVGLYVADVVGHGMPAALLTMFIKRALITKKITGNSYELIEPGKALSALNQDFIEQKLSNFQFATACYGILNTENLTFQFASAGHPHPMWIAHDGTINDMATQGSLLGVFPDQEYETSKFQLNPGDKLLIYSDGVEVAFTDNGPDEEYRYRQEFIDCAHNDINSMCEKLVEIIEREEGSLHPRDDVTIVGMEIDPE